MFGQIQPTSNGVLDVVSEKLYQSVAENVLTVLGDELLLL